MKMMKDKEVWSIRELFLHQVDKGQVKPEQPRSVHHEVDEDSMKPE